MTASALTVALMAALLAALLSAAAIPTIHPLLVKYALARPNARSSHQIPTPQGAGIAVVAATLAAATIALLWFGASARDFPFTACVIIDADAFEIAQPEPLKATSFTLSSSIST